MMCTGNSKDTSRDTRPVYDGIDRSTDEMVSHDIALVVREEELDFFCASDAFWRALGL